MGFSHRVSFRKTWGSTDLDRFTGEPEATVWHHSLMNGGSISVQKRLTGWGFNVWDVETGYKSPCGKFWLASGDCDIREYLCLFNSEDELIDWVIRNANTCTGSDKFTYPHITLDRMKSLGYSLDQ